MILFPAIDLRCGQVVRLQQGDPGRQTVFGSDPAEVARRFEVQGAEWLHVVNLDGALGEAAEGNLRALDAIRRAVSLPIQFGGGVRTAEAVAALLNRGVTRVMLGTVALEQPERVGEWLARFGAERLVVALDTRGGKMAAHGWQTQSEVSAADLALRLKGQGVARVIYTDIPRDGMLSGVDVEGCAHLAETTGLRVIASGGAAGLEDIRALKTRPGVEGLIIGRALYTAALDLAAALMEARS